MAGPHKLLVDPQDRKKSPLAIRGTLALEDGATVWLGVVWKGASGADGRALRERPAEAALAS